MNNFLLFLGIIFLSFFLSANSKDFYNTLPVPYLINQDNIQLSIDYMNHDFDPGNPSSTINNVVTYAYNQVDSLGKPSQLTILGPSLVWNYLHNLNINVYNNLDHGATVHWHGAHVPPFADGGPHQVIDVNTTWKLNIQVLDKASTMWYHPHVMDFTYEQVQMGMSGMLYVQDEQDSDDRDDEILVELHKLLPTEYGINDFPVILQTKVFSQDTNNPDSVYIELGQTQRTKNDYEYIINGVVNPVLKVPNEMTRFRFLCGDARYAFNLGIEYNSNPINSHLIATDAGYTDKSYERSTIMFSPGERMEWLVDFSEYNNGDTLFLYNYSEDLPDGVIGKDKFKGVQAPNTPLLAFVIDNSINAPKSEISSFPIPLLPKEIFNISEAKTRTKNLRQDKLQRPDNGEVNNIYNIDSTVMDMMVVNDTILLGSTEIWEIDNQTDVAHPWHIHLTHFFVLDITDSTGNLVEESEYPNIFGGPLDNVLIQPGWKLRYAIEFNNFGVPEVKPEDGYMYHCHILPHEDAGMMGQFVVWDSLATSVDDKAILNHKLVVYPNPSTEFIYLEGNSDLPSTIRFLDIMGNVAKEMMISPFNEKYMVSSSDLPSGIYYLEWISEEQISRCKILIE
ncbi:multicopper oxidase domain-containing protein [Candidatus Kapabacteria bacterium]|nr:multicopper oxidase domain-containing protein [Candidatus Kapabacteria bacterium]